ncbi:uncharacterized protein LOC115632934 [Scaptodrosophila lebanonensis]|uniref:Uncharacterized protein LOC115632934 n=1 Tax=Drosophila lebanonensis TaxID=7225 RepID=A0A6J2UG50_DROLE|nr:uncharacterized protein LOC115632934 [Scaptodrosophila lebanonensis]
MFQPKGLAFYFTCLLLCLTTFNCLCQALPLDELSREDDRFNEISSELDRRIIPEVDRIFSSAEEPTATSENPNNALQKSEGPTSEASKHAHSMLASMMSFVSSALHFGRRLVR